MSEYKPDCVEEMNRDLSRPSKSVLSISIKPCGHDSRNHEMLEITIGCKCGQKVLKNEAKVVIDRLCCLLTVLTCVCGKEYHIQTDVDRVHIYEHK